MTACTTEHFDLLFSVGRLRGCPERGEARRARLFAVRLEAIRARVREVLGERPEAGSADRVCVAVLDDARDQRRLARGLTRLESQGLGNSIASRKHIVLHRPRTVGDDAALRGLLAHAVAHVVADVGGAADADRSGWGWLDAGLAHWFEDDASGRSTITCYHGRPQPPLLFWGGDWRTAARELLEAGDLPSLREVMATEASDLDLAQHVVAFAFVDFLQARGGGAAPVTHGERVAPASSVPALGSLVRASRRGEASAVALRRVLGRDSKLLDVGFHQFVRERYPRR